MNRNLSSSVLRLSSETITVQRPAASSYNTDGILVAAGSPTTFSAQASVQPVPGNELKRLPEGLQTQELALFFTKTALMTADAANARKADVLVRLDGSTYEVQLVQAWGLSGGYCRAIAMRREV